MRMNAQMQALYSTFLAAEAVEISAELKAIVQSEFVNREGCWFLNELYLRRGNAALSVLPDQVGYECYVNHIHIDDFTTTEKLLPVALLCAQMLKANWISQSIPGSLRIILSIEDGDCVLRFHAIHDQQSWLSDDLDKYEAAIAVIE